MVLTFEIEYASTSNPNHMPSIDPRQNSDVYKVAKIVGAILILRSGGFGWICCDRGEYRYLGVLH